MATTYTRPSGAYTSTSTTTNANKYQTDSGASTAISSSKVDGDMNQLIDAVNQLGVDIDGVIVGGWPTQSGNADKVLKTNGTAASWTLTDTANIATDAITTVKITDGNVTEAKLATSAVTATKLGTSAVTTVKVNDNAITLAKLAGGTAGKIIGFDGSGDPAELTRGLDFISSTTISGTPATVDITAGIDSTYDEYVIIPQLVPVTDNTQLEMRFTDDAGSTFKSGSTDYEYHFGQSVATSTAYAGVASAGADHIKLYTQQGTGSGEFGNVIIHLHNPSDATLFTPCTWHGTAYNGTAFSNTNGAGMYNGSAVAVDGFQLFYSSGNIASGTVMLYGISKS